MSARGALPPTRREPLHGQRIACVVGVRAILADDVHLLQLKQDATSALRPHPLAKRALGETLADVKPVSRFNGAQTRLCSRPFTSAACVGRMRLRRPSAGWGPASPHRRSRQASARPSERLVWSRRRERCRPSATSACRCQAARRPLGEPPRVRIPDGRPATESRRADGHHASADRRSRPR
jgi:hypothetical protein